MAKRRTSNKNKRSRNDRDQDNEDEEEYSEPSESSSESSVSEQSQPVNSASEEEEVSSISEEIEIVKPVKSSKTKKPSKLEKQTEKKSRGRAPEVPQIRRAPPRRGTGGLIAAFRLLRSGHLNGFLTDPNVRKHFIDAFTLLGDFGQGHSRERLMYFWHLAWRGELFVRKLQNNRNKGKCTACNLRRKLRYCFYRQTNGDLNEQYFADLDDQNDGDVELLGLMGPNCFEDKFLKLITLSSVCLSLIPLIDYQDFEEFGNFDQFALHVLHPHLEAIKYASANMAKRYPERVELDDDVNDNQEEEGEESDEEENDEDREENSSEYNEDDEDDVEENDGDNANDNHQEFPVEINRDLFDAWENIRVRREEREHEIDEEEARIRANHQEALDKLEAQRAEIASYGKPTPPSKNKSIIIIDLIEDDDKHPELPKPNFNRVKPAIAIKLSESNKHHKSQHKSHHKRSDERKSSKDPQPPTPKKKVSSKSSSKDAPVTAKKNLGRFAFGFDGYQEEELNLDELGLEEMDESPEIHASDIQPLNIQSSVVVEKSNNNMPRARIPKTYKRARRTVSSEDEDDIE